MIGGEFAGHPWHQLVTVRVEDPAHPASGSYRDKFEITDEIYQFKNWDRSNLHSVLSLDASNDERPKTPAKPGEPSKGFFDRGARPDHDYAVAWVREFGKGRVFYTSLGHRDEVWNDPKVQEHMLGGIQWALDIVPAAASAK
jgi:type 1 glutamine amidotransferase